MMPQLPNSAAPLDTKPPATAEPSEQSQPATKIDERYTSAFLGILESVEKEDEYLRQQQLREFKKYNLFWHGFQYLFWSEDAGDWRVPTHEEFEEISSNEENKFVFDYVINIFKAHGESIIAALSSDVPDVRFGPKDAQDPDDTRAVEAADNCVELIEKWNRSKSLIINALFFLITEGFVASYTYNKKDEAHGTVPINEYGTQPVNGCPGCGAFTPRTPGGAQGQPSDPQTEDTNYCAECGTPTVQDEIPVLTGTKLLPKGREVIEIYGPCNVRMAQYVSKQADSGWLIHYVDADPALFMDAFPDYADEISVDPGQSYERLMRQSSLVRDGQQMNTRIATQKRVWLRPWMLNRLKPDDADLKNELRGKYPHGVYFSVIGSTVVETRDESMDKHWTVTKAGPSKGLLADPTLKALVPVQEIRNNLVNLFTMQVEYGVPATYADTEVFDFHGQARQEVSPGYIYPISVAPGKTASEAFYTERTTSLSKESTQLLQTCDSDGQFVVGSYPSIYGGPAQGGSKTLGEYDKSRSFALQRLGLLWFFVDNWWGETLHKSVLSFIDHQLEDESTTSELSPGQFQTKWVRRADLKGSFDRLEPDSSSDFPTSFSQKRQILMALFQLNNDAINSVLMTPENAPVLKAYMGLPEIKMPTDVQRNKQMREILYLIGFEPQELEDGTIQSTVAVEPEIDEHPVHIEVLTYFLVSDVGQDLKENNPQGYANCLAHLMEHKQAMQPPMPGGPQVGPPGPGGPGLGGPPPPQPQPQGAPVNA